MLAYIPAPWILYDPMGISSSFRYSTNRCFLKPAISPIPTGVPQQLVHPGPPVPRSIPVPPPVRANRSSVSVSNGTRAWNAGGARIRVLTSAERTSWGFDMIWLIWHNWCFFLQNIIVIGLSIKTWICFLQNIGECWKQIGFWAPKNEKK